MCSRVRACVWRNLGTGCGVTRWRVRRYCCNCSHSFTIRSDWLQDGGTTFLGEATYNGYQVCSTAVAVVCVRHDLSVRCPCALWQAYEWLKYGSEANHYLATTDGT